MISYPLPVSVITPITRENLYRAVTLPTIEACRPAQVIAVRGNEGASEKRNLGAERSSHPFLFFCDDDVILAPHALERLVKPLLGSRQQAAFTYCDFMVVNHPGMGCDIVRPGRWDEDRLRQSNYISTMSMVRREAFERAGGFDESLARFQDWDLWLTMAEQGMTGHYVETQTPLFTALYLGAGITRTEGRKSAIEVVQKKHGIAA